MRDVDALVVPDPQKNRWGGWRPNSGRPKREDWQEPFLARLAECGATYRAAYDVGVDVKTVTAERERNPDFADAFHEARNLFADDLEILLRDQGDGTVRGNPLPVFALLKKHRPQEYIERHAILNVDVHIDVPTDQARQVLGEMLAHVTPSTVERLSAEQPHRDAAPSLPTVLDVSPTSLVAMPKAAHGSDVRASVGTTGERSVGVGHVASLSGIRAQSPSAKEGEAAASGALALPAAELASSPPIQARKPLNTGRQA